MFKLHKLNYSTLPSRTLQTLKSTNEKVNTKIKGTFFEKWVTYWKLIVRDYRDVILNVKNDIKNKPLKSAVYFTGAGFLGFCAELNPDLPNFRAKIIESSNELGVVPQAMANPQSIEHLKYVERCFNRNLVRYTNLGVLSIIWVDKYSKDCDLYESNCSYLRVPFWGISDRILDVGFLNVWWITSRKMLDYDINY